jgi:ATP-dependent Clp protease protease subunit
MKKDDDSIGVAEKIQSTLLKNHIHYLYGDIDEQNTAEVIKWIIYENLSGTNKELQLMINSNGGNLPDAFALIEVMKKSKNPITTIGIGSVCSSAFLIFAAGHKGKRLIGNNATILCHQFSNEHSGKYHDLKASIRENELVNNRMIKILEECTELDSRTIKSKLLCPTDVWLTADELVELGVADDIF